MIEPNPVEIIKNSQIEHDIPKPYQSDFSEISIYEILQSDIIKTLPDQFTEFELDKMDIPFSQSEIKLLGELTQQYRQGQISDTELISKILNFRGGMDPVTYQGVLVICYFFFHNLGASKTEAFTLTHMVDRCLISHYAHSSVAKAHRDNAEQNRNANCKISKMAMNSPESTSLSEYNVKSVFQDLPDGKNFCYEMNQGRGLKKLAEKAWNDSKQKSEIIRMLERFDDKNVNLQLKAYQN